MTYEQIQDLQPADCKRACGGHPQPCETMLQVLQEHGQKTMPAGRPAKRSVEDQLVMPLQAWRADRTSCHRGLSWGVDASGVGRTVCRSAPLLSKRKAFHVPGKQTLPTGDTQFAVIVVDVAASPVERPQKN